MPKTSAHIEHQAVLSADPASPPSGYSVIYPKSDGKWYAKSSAGVVTEITNVAGGADPWTYLKLTSDFTTSSATAVDVTGLSFSPSASLDYEVEVVLLCQTPTATVGPRIGFAWGIGTTANGAIQHETPSSATTETIVRTTMGVGAGSTIAAVGGFPITGTSFRVTGSATFRSGSGTPPAFRTQMASETAGTVITVKAGSFLRYRTY